jgi:hypothetical protein
MCARFRLSVLLCVSLLAGVHLSNCGKPEVLRTSVSGEVRSIDHWEIRWTDADSVRAGSAVNLSGVYETSKYDEPGEALGYVLEVKHHLITDHGISFSENFPARGLILLKLTGLAWADPQLQAHPGDTIWSGERLQDGGDKSYDKEKPGLHFDGEHLRDRVKGVHVRIYDLAGRLAGDARIGYDADDKVTPEYVAEVIARLLSGQ